MIDMNLENNSSEFEVRNEDFEYIAPENIESLNLPELLPKYEGEGETSFSEKHDTKKLEYLNSLGIEIPEEWTRDRAMLISGFIVTGVLLVLKNIERDDPENLKLVVRDKNKQLKDLRIDEYGYRRRLANGLSVEDYHKKLGFSANPQKKVSEEELKRVVEHIVVQLSR